MKLLLDNKDDGQLDRMEKELSKYKKKIENDKKKSTSEFEDYKDQ